MTRTNGLQHRRKALILSPSASHPQDHGNRNRVFQTTSLLKDAGYEVHFVLYPFESDWVNEVPASAAEMREAWDSFVALPPSRPLHMPAAGEHHLIDEWWDPQIGTYLEWLFARDWFDVFVVNYTFFSKAFDYAPASTVKVLETHDMFAGRKELFATYGAPAEFFYTTRDQEQLALDRADIVIAIKDAEAANLRRNTKSAEVISIPFYMKHEPLAPRAERLQKTEELRVGFIGALNSVNVLNMQRFLERFEKYRTIYMPPPISISIAGDVCLKLHANSPAIELLGRVDDVTAFYQSIDIVVAPMSFSTGIKIKVGEALSWGKPVVATQNGFDGFPPVDPFHSLESVDAVCRALMKLSFDRERLQLLEQRTEVAARLAQRRCLDGYRALNKAILRRSRRIAFITDAAIWKSDSIRQTRLAQWCELCTYITRTTVIYVGADEPGKFPKTALQLARFTDLLSPGKTPADALRVIDMLRQSYEVIEVVLSVGGDFGRQILDGLKKRVRFVTLDNWVPELAAMAAEQGAGAEADLWLSSDEMNVLARGISTTATRYLPAGLDVWRKKKSTSEILVALCAPDPEDLAGVNFLLETETTAGSISLSDFRPNEEGGDETVLFSQLRDRDMPRIIVSIGQSRRAAEIARCVAAYWSIEYLHLSAAEFPYMLGNGDPALMCFSFADVARYLCTETNGEIKYPSHGGDVGWSTYWRLITKRKVLNGARSDPAAAPRHEFHVRV
ncbi:MAG TPA: glycosyltransferase [Rhizomicrobium sp.]|jgi:glycosyltransferase involved in cell wall biosynthesis|nr:glycosyltransferase [Rhizomicrobium sp.]